MRTAALIPALLLLVACGRKEAETAKLPLPPAQTSLGNPAQGQKLVAEYGCLVCHAIPGAEGPQGSLGPSLAGLGSRPTLSGGAVQNTPENLVQFIQNPASLNPQSSMPPIGMPAGDANHIAAYLLTLK
jgi:cytochrome c